MGASLSPGNTSTLYSRWYRRLYVLKDEKHLAPRVKLEYRVTYLVGENLLLTFFQQFWQLVGRY